MNKTTFSSAERRRRFYNISALVLTSVTMLFVLVSNPITEKVGIANRVHADSVYFNLTLGSLSFAITPSTTNLITSNDNWSGVPSVEGYEGRDITATHGINPQTVLGTEFVNNQLPNSPRNVAANKGNPSAFNAGGLAEFDTGTPLALGFQGNVHANPYMVFYLNTTGRTAIHVSYDVIDIDGGSNNSVSPLALQYRVGETGNFTNLPAGYIADATDGGVAGRMSHLDVVLPAAAENQAKVQVRIITTNAAAPDGTSTPDEWIGVNNVVISSTAVVTAAPASISGRVVDQTGRGIPKAFVTIYDPTGNVKTVMTNLFGNYNFADVETGTTYVVAVYAKGQRFSQAMRTVLVLDSVAGFDFIADN